MDANKILHTDLLDIIFKSRNKTYGAYYLRKTYHKRLLYSLIILFALTALAIASYFIDATVSSKKVVVEVTDINLSDIKDVPKDLPPPPPPPKQEQPKIEVKKFTEILLEKKDNLKPEELRPEIDLEDLVDANIGVVDIEGITTTDLAPPPVVDEGPGENFVFTSVEVKPEPNGGFAGFRRRLRRNLNASVGADNGAPPGKYRVVIKFVVEKNGELTQIQTVGKIHGYGMEEEAMRVLREDPPWTPGQNNGQPVRAYYSQPIVFLVEVD